MSRKKVLLSLGTVTSVMVPLTTVVACGSSSNEGKEDKTQLRPC